eukprot:13136459-Alexandrium_andersonii.AAC.1
MHLRERPRPGPLRKPVVLFRPEIHALLRWCHRTVRPDTEHDPMRPPGCLGLPVALGLRPA